MVIIIVVVLVSFILGDKTQKGPRVAYFQG